MSGLYVAGSSMNYIVAGMMVIDLLFLVCCTRHTRAVPKFPLYGIDWLGAALWSAFLLQTAYFFCYGQFHDWLDSPVMKTLAVTGPVTLAVCILRMTTIRHPFYEPGMWSYRHLIPVLLLIAAVECILATEHVLEESFIGSALYSRGLAYFITDNAARYGAALDSVAVSADPAGYASAAGQFAAGMEKRQGRHSLDIRKTHPFHALIIKFFRKKILFYLILYLNLRRKIPEWGLHVTIY